MNNQEELKKEFIAWLKAKNLNPKTEEEVQKHLKTFMAEKQAKKQQQARKAAHGAKLQYFKTLKNQCADDEELVYYKKGGKVDCGCVKKQVEKHESGGKPTWKDEWNKAKNKVRDTAYSTISAVSKTGHGIAQTDQNRIVQQGPKKKPNKNTWGATSQVVGKDVSRGSGNDTSGQEKKSPSARDYYNGKSYSKKYCGGAKMKLVKKGDKVCPKCGKVHKGGLGCQFRIPVKVN